MGRFIWRTRTSSSVRLLCVSDVANPVGKTPFRVGPVRVANSSLSSSGVPVGEGDGLGETVGDGDGVPVGVPVGEGDGVGVRVGDGLGELVGDGLGEPVGDGDGVPVGVPVGVTLGEIEGVGVGPPPKTPATSTVVPLRTCTVDPSLITGTACPSSVFSFSRPRPRASRTIAPMALPLTTAVSEVPCAKFTASISTSSSRFPLGYNCHSAWP